MASSSQGDRSIATGGLAVDGERISIELNHETYRVSGDGTAIGSNYNFAGKLPLIATDKGIVLKEIKEALAEGRTVTAETGLEGRTEFTKKGPLVLGFSEKQALISVGRFGLNSALGL